MCSLLDEGDARCSPASNARWLPRACCPPCTRCPRSSADRAEAAARTRRRPPALLLCGGCRPWRAARHSAAGRCTSCCCPPYCKQVPATSCCSRLAALDDGNMQVVIDRVGGWMIFHGSAARCMEKPTWASRTLSGILAQILTARYMLIRCSLH
ncbi:hypothetical protein Dimus_011106, partial [Dionaea muscipula]